MDEANKKGETPKSPSPEIQQTPPPNIYPLPKNKKGARKLIVLFLIFIIIGISIIITSLFLFKNKSQLNLLKITSQEQSKINGSFKTNKQCEDATKEKCLLDMCQTSESTDTSNWNCKPGYKPLSRFSNSNENLKTPNNKLNETIFTDFDGINLSDITTKHYSNDEFFVEGIKYSEKIKTDNSELQISSCSNRYLSAANKEYIDINASKEKGKLTNKYYLELLENIGIYIRSDVGASILCKVGDKILITYEKWTDKDNEVYVGFYQSEKNFNDFIKISETPTLYFGCEKVLQISQNNEVYLSCGYGDSNSLTKFIYKADLNRKTLTTIAKCSLLTLRNENRTKVECK